MRTFVISLLLSVVAQFAATADAGATFPATPAVSPSRAGTAAAHLRTLRREAARDYQAARIAPADATRRYWLRVMHRPLPPPKADLGRLALAELRRAADWRWQRALEI